MLDSMIPEISSAEGVINAKIELYLHSNVWIPIGDENEINIKYENSRLIKDKITQLDE